MNFYFQRKRNAHTDSHPSQIEKIIQAFVKIAEVLDYFAKQFSLIMSQLTEDRAFRHTALRALRCFLFDATIE